MNRTALMMERRQVEALIKYDPIEVVLRRRTKVSDGAGGWTWSDYTPLTPQEMTLIPFKRRLAEMTVNTELGDVVNYPWMLIATPDKDLERGDLFTYNGDEFEVMYLDLKEYVRKAAAVDYYSGTNNG